MSVGLTCESLVIILAPTLLQAQGTPLVPSRGTLACGFPRWCPTFLQQPLLLYSCTLRRIARRTPQPWYRVAVSPPWQKYDRGTLLQCLLQPASQMIPTRI